ncbi:guanine-N(7)--methyltransferase subunit TRM82 [Ampelomyces quisqualis]|uniref:Guanine-N(7)--methyltransferase subunit TRM82 n=1 Tax=Ampelomyces quisqualis TaxID=50730 RepID=A0A6A5QA59_AMPQU|nr:guanine-N(7)--methyltransferase subunit TRM82 [Ampelomyces quisqualis]
MQFPYQCIVARSEPSESSISWTLFGASGSKIVVHSSNGATSVWPQQVGQMQISQEDEPQEPPGKRIKLSPPKEPNFNFSCLTLSNDGNYLVGVTGEDKCIRVFQVDSQSRLKQLSERCMSRRPSSITLTSDDTTILCADKFGDVYALPLLPSPEDEQPEAAPPAKSEPEDKNFMPSATVLTVHSGRNRKTLEEQLKQNAKGPLKTKEAMSFKHELLLGHVSMLTDLAFVNLEGRGYIITADRDEHIRISRGIPQAHIIEGFCFGHEEFVSRMCVTRSGRLISGGGDGQVFVWDWQNCQLVEKLPLRDIAIQHLKTRPDINSLLSDEAAFKTAVTGIWEIPSSKDQGTEVVVACEGLPVLFSFKVDIGAVLGSSLALSGNPLDVAFVQTSQNSWTMIVSVDNVHTPGSTAERRGNQDASRLQCFATQADGQWSEDAGIREALNIFAEAGCNIDTAFNDGPSSGPTESKGVRDILYHVENLRKRPGAED